MKSTNCQKSLRTRSGEKGGCRSNSKCNSHSCDMVHCLGERALFSSFVAIFWWLLPSNAPLRLYNICYWWVFFSQGIRWTKYLTHWNLLTARHRSYFSVSFSRSYSHLLRQYTGLHNSAAKQQLPLLTMLLLYQFWLTEICICCKPSPTRDEMPHQQIALPMTLTLPFFYTFGTLHARHIHTIFELWGRPFCSLLLVSFFRWKEFNSHSVVVTFHFSCSLSSPPVAEFT